MYLTNYTLKTSLNPIFPSLHALFARLLTPLTVVLHKVMFRYPPFPVLSALLGGQILRYDTPTVSCLHPVLCIAVLDWGSSLQLNRRD